MSQIKLISLVIAAFLLLSFNPSMAATQTVAMSGGTVSHTENAAAVTGGYDAFNYEIDPLSFGALGDNPRWLRADILAAAYVPKGVLGSSQVTTIVDPADTNTKVISTAGITMPGAVPQTASTTLSVTAGGTVSADVHRTAINPVTDSSLLSYGYITSEAVLSTTVTQLPKIVGPIPCKETVNNIVGTANIQSGIGSADGLGSLTQAAFQDGASGLFSSNFDLTHAIGTGGPAKGKFTADASAQGTASYHAMSQIDDGPGSTSTYDVKGSVISTSALTASSAGLGGTIGGDWNPASFTTTMSQIDRPAIAFLSATSSVDVPSGRQESETEGYVTVGSKNAFASNLPTSITGDLTGSATASTSQALYTAEMGRSTLADLNLGHMDASASVYQGADEARGGAIADMDASIDPTGITVPHTSEGGLATGAMVSRSHDNAQKAFGTGFINDANWDASTTTEMDLAPSQVGGTSISGATGTVQPGFDGMGAGTFLQFRKTLPASASSAYGSRATWQENPANPLLPVATAGTIFATQIVGPAVNGASSNDGSGVYSDIENANAHVDYNTVGPILVTPGQIDTSIASQTDLKWVDGTNGQFWNGQGFGPINVQSIGNLIYFGPTQVPIGTVNERTTTTLFGTTNNN